MDTLTRRPASSPGPVLCRLLLPLSSFSLFFLTSHLNCSPGSHYCYISLFIFPFESLPPAKMVLFLAPFLGVNNLGLRYGGLQWQGPNRSSQGRIGKGGRDMPTNLLQGSWAWLGRERTRGDGGSASWDDREVLGLSAWARGRFPLLKSMFLLSVLGRLKEIWGWRTI